MYMSEERHIQLELPFDDIAMESGEKPVKAMSSVARKKTDAPANTRMRAKRRRIRVTFDDGTTICDTSATATMIMTIEKIGVERVASLDMENCHVPLVSRQVVDRYAEWTKQMADGWYLMAQGDTEQKYRQLKVIFNALSIDAIIELGNFETIVAKESNRKSNNARKHKSHLAVTLPNGMVICDNNHLFTFKQAVRHIGIDKVEKTKLKIGGNPITTTVKRYNNQVQLSPEKWLTVPSSVKDKYKILRILSAMTHTPFEVKIIEG